MGFDIAPGFTLTSPDGTTLSLDGTVANVMKVDASGIVTRSQTPYFRGQISGRGSYHNNAGGPLLVISDVNRGNCWNNANGIWTCPVAGYYIASMFSICGANSGYLYLYKNGVNQRYTHWNHSGGWHNVTLSGVLQCAAGDTIDWRIGSYNPTTTGVHGNGNHAMYSIALMA